MNLEIFINLQFFSSQQYSRAKTVAPYKSSRRLPLYYVSLLYLIAVSDVSLERQYDELCAYSKVS